MTLHLSASEARRLHDHLVAIPGVGGLYEGRFGENALLLPGERVYGIRYASRDSSVADPTGLTIYVIVDVSAGRTVFQVSDSVRARVLELTDAEFVDVVVADACNSSSSLIQDDCDESAVHP